MRAQAAEANDAKSKRAAVQQGEWLLEPGALGALGARGALGPFGAKKGGQRGVSGSHPPNGTSGNFRFFVFMFSSCGLKIW